MIFVKAANLHDLRLQLRPFFGWEREPIVGVLEAVSTVSLTLPKRFMDKDIIIKFSDDQDKTD